MFIKRCAIVALVICSFFSETYTQQFIQKIVNHLGMNLELILPVYSNDKISIKGCVSIADGTVLMKPGLFSGTIIIPARSEITFDKLVIPENGDALFGGYIQNSIRIGFYFPHRRTHHPKYPASRHPKYFAVIDVKAKNVIMNSYDTYKVNDKILQGGCSFCDPVTSGASYNLSINSDRPNLSVQPDLRYLRDNNRLILDISKNR